MIALAYWVLRNIAGRTSFGFDVRSADHLAPFLGLVGDKFVKVSGRARKHNPAGFSEARSRAGVGEAGIDRLVESFNDIGRRIPGCAETIPVARFVVGHELAHRWDIG